MTISLTQEDYCRLWQETTVGQSTDDCPYSASERIEVCPAGLGVGSRRWVELREIDMLIHDYELHQDVEVQHYPGHEGLEFGFQLLGGSYAQRCAGHNFVQKGPSSLRNTYRKSGERNLQIDIHIGLVDGFDWFLPRSADVGSLHIQQLLQRSDQEPFTQIDTTTPAMQSVLDQMLHCPFEGLTRQIYLEAKCWELIALKLDQLATESPTMPLGHLNRDDIDRIHEAKAILTHRWQKPPSLLELAWQVGLNDYKLKLGFRQVFGTTAFGYLWHYRMEQARQLLIEGRYNINEVSTLVGYAKQSSFAAAFRKKYGMSPKAYQAEIRLTGRKSV